MAEEPLPFTIRVAGNERQLRKAVSIRQRAYGRHVPALAELLRVPEAKDHEPGCVVLVAESKLDGEPLGTMRIQTNRYRPLAIEASVALPAWLSGNVLAEATRLLQTRGLNFLASYTLGKTTDHVSGLNIGGEARPVLPVVQGDEASIDSSLEAEKGPALFDARHRFVLSFGYALPDLESASTIVRAVAGGWQLNGIYQAQTGFPLTVTRGAVLDIRYMTNRPDIVAGCDPNDGPKTTAQWFNTSCFAALPLALTGERPGNAGRNSVRGPGFQRTDLSIFKNFDFATRHRIQVRIEGFNILNQARFAQPNGTLGAATFGQITAAEDGRVIPPGARPLCP
jgi:hypothetical protein